MFQKFLNWVRQVISKVIGVSDVKKATGIAANVSSDMIQAMELWERMYRNQPDWMTDNLIPLNLPAAVA